MAEAEQADDSDELYDQTADAEQADDSDQLYDQQTESEKAEYADKLYDQLGESEQADHQLQEQPGESERAADSDKYDPLVEPEPVSQTDPNEGDAEYPQGEVSAPPHVDGRGGAGVDTRDHPGGEVESADHGELPIEDRRTIEDYRPYDQKNEVRESNVEAWRRLGASILP
jgi:hypothetical protein